VIGWLCLLVVEGREGKAALCQREPASPLVAVCCMFIVCEQERSDQPPSYRVARDIWPMMLTVPAATGNTKRRGKKKGVLLVSTAAAALRSHAASARQQHSVSLSLFWADA